MNATIELEKHEKAFDEYTDNLFTKRFIPLNQVLKSVS
jgi:hypothetical protein